MPTSRFLLVGGLAAAGGPTPGWPSRARTHGGAVREGSWVAWRLLGGNNRELGRSAQAYPSAADAVAAVTWLRGSLAEAVATHGTDDRGLWRWRLTLGDTVLVVSARAYLRQRESHYSLGQFLAAVPSADGPRALPTVLAVPEPAAPVEPDGEPPPPDPHPQPRPGAFPFRGASWAR